MPEEWSYRRLCDALRDEKVSNALTRLPPEYEQSVREMLAALSAGSHSSSEAARELENARRQAIALLRVRRHKIVMRAALSVSGHEQLEGLSAGEHELYDRIHATMRAQDEQILQALMPANGGGAAKRDVQTLKKIQILKDITAFRGADATTYGPYVAGQEAALPEGEVEWMIQKQQARAILD